MKSRQSLLNAILIGLISVLGFMSSSLAQDTLVYKSGKVQPVNIISVDKYEKVIEYKLDERTFIVSMIVLDKYFSKNKWTELNFEKESSMYPVDIYENHFDVRSPLSIGTNITSALMGMVDDNEGPLLSDRPLITIEPEYRLKNKLISIKGSIAIGIPSPSVYTFSPRYTNSTSNGIVNYYFPNEDYSQMEIYNYYDDGNRTRYVSFEGGLSLKFWPSKRLRERFFVFGGVMIGQCDYKAITIYDTFEEYEDWSTMLRIKDQVIDVRDNPFVYTRLEAGLGYSFQLSNRFALSTDLCFTNKPLINKGSEPDLVYARFENGTYEKVYEEKYFGPTYTTYFPLWKNVLFRFKFRYHFLKK